MRAVFVLRPLPNRPRLSCLVSGLVLVNILYHKNFQRSYGQLDSVKSKAVQSSRSSATLKLNVDSTFHKQPSKHEYIDMTEDSSVKGEVFE